MAAEHIYDQSAQPLPQNPDNIAAPAGGEEQLATLTVIHGGAQSEKVIETFDETPLPLIPGSYDYILTYGNQPPPSGPEHMTEREKAGYAPLHPREAGRHALNGFGYDSPSAVYDSSKFGAVDPIERQENMVNGSLSRRPDDY